MRRRQRSLFLDFNKRYNRNMNDDDTFDQRLVRSARHYAQLYPSVMARLKAAYDSGHPLVRQVARAMSEALNREALDREALLRDGHGLSAAEARVVLHLVEGGSVKSYAETQGVAESTVRTHLKAIYSKTGVNRQALLGRLFDRAPDPPRRPRV